jgi:hypothetical protein
VSDETNSRIVASPNRDQTSTPRFLLIFASPGSLQPARQAALLDQRQGDTAAQMIAKRIEPSRQPVEATSTFGLHP